MIDSNNRILYVLRHAKSSWDDEHLSDFERPLNQRGKRASSFMGEFMHENNFLPKRIVSSPAVRAKKTIERVAAGAHFEVAIEYDERIYEASPMTLLNVIRETEDEVKSVLIIGHNPGLEGLISRITSDYKRMATATLAVIKINSPKWSELGTGAGKFSEIYYPSKLMK